MSRVGLDGLNWWSRTVSLPVSFLSRLPIGAENVQIKTLVTAWVKDDTRE